MTYASARAIARGLGWVVVALWVTARTGNAQAVAAAVTPTRVAVVGNDYAFLQLANTMVAGQTLFSFENRGSVRHEMSMVLLKPGVTLQQVVQHGPGAASSRALAERPIGILIARAGESSGGQLLVDLRPGQRYLVVCTLKDSPDGRSHVELGMVTSFDVP